VGTAAGGTRSNQREFKVRSALMATLEKWETTRVVRRTFLQRRKLNPLTLHS